MKKSDIHILVVDDDETIRGALSQIIEKAGFKVSAVSNPAEAENTVRLKSFQLAIIDCMLSMTNGIDLAKRLIDGALKNAPIFLMSGIFKDQQFAEEALKKSGAVEFFTKPFDNAALVAKINAMLAPMLDYKGGSIESLMTNLDLSKRESQKALDYIENSSGYDLLLIFNILMRSKVSGYLNITEKNKKLYGFSLYQGKICDVDTLKDVKEVASLAVQMGLVNESEAKDMLSLIDKRDPIKFLIRENLISPHMAKSIREDKILGDYKRLVMTDQVNVSFIENREMTKPDFLINKDNFDFLNFEFCMQKINIEWLENLYENWQNKNIDLAKDFEQNNLLKNLTPSQLEIINEMKEQKTLADLASLFSKEEVYRLTYYLLSGRLLCFSNESTSVHFRSLEEKYEDLYAKLQNKNPFEIFHFFGSKENPNQNEVENIYKEFAKINHPDKLPKEASTKAKDLNTRVYSIVSEAYSTLANAEKRQTFLNSIREKEARVQIKTEENVDKAKALLEKSQYALAYEILVESYALLKNKEVWLLLQWARFKFNHPDFKNDLENLKLEIGGFTVQEKQSALFYFVFGLISVAEKNYIDAEKYFYRSLDIDKSFLAARREMALLKTKQMETGSKSVDLFTGDVTSIVSSFFKKKSG